ncbi:MAG: hypothetical protein KDK51_07990 [Deltaproteobacteria bacterium]|nr:hypothetical protein [Deltaproteobacteria bacterium]
MKNFVLGFLLLLAGYQTVLAQEVLSGEKAENYIKKHFVFTGVEEVFHEKAEFATHEFHLEFRVNNDGYELFYIYVCLEKCSNLPTSLQIAPVQDPADLEHVFVSWSKNRAIEFINKLDPNMLQGISPDQPSHMQLHSQDPDHRR